MLASNLHAARFTLRQATSSEVRGYEHSPLAIWSNTHLLAASVKWIPSQMILVYGFSHGFPSRTSVPLTLPASPHLTLKSKLKAPPPCPQQDVRGCSNPASVAKFSVLVDENWMWLKNVTIVLGLADERVLGWVDIDISYGRERELFTELGYCFIEHPVELLHQLVEWNRAPNRICFIGCGLRTKDNVGKAAEGACVVDPEVPSSVFIYSLCKIRAIGFRCSINIVSHVFKYWLVLTWITLENSAIVFGKNSSADLLLK